MKFIGSNRIGKGRTIRFLGGGVGSFMKKKITLAMGMKKKSPLSWGGIHPWSPGEKFTLAKVKEKNHPLTKLPTPLGNL